MNDPGRTDNLEPENEPKKVHSGNLNPNLKDSSALKEIRLLEFLPELFGLFLDIEQGRMQAKDFEKNLGTTRLNIATSLSKLQGLEGICDSISDQKTTIQSLAERKRIKDNFSRDLQKSILLKFNQYK